MNVVGLVYPPVITAEFPVTQRYSSFSGWYKMTAVGGDSLRISVLMAVGNTEMGYTIANLPGTGSSYVQFSMNLAYLLPGNPDTCFISALITGPASASDSPHVGSTFWLDDLSLSGTATAVAQQPGAPRTFALDQNFPNPFNPTTQISYELAAAGPVRLTVYDVLGRKVASLVDGEEQAGSHQVRFDGTGLASGVYIYRLQTPSALLQKKMMLVK
jgi:hypothetical protein